MSLEDFGWVYHNPDHPPKSCRCKRELVTISGVHVCPQCDFTHMWPITGYDNTV